MKLLIQQNKKSLRLWVPNWLFHEKLILHFAKDEIQSEMFGQLGELRHALKAYVKEYGHFTFIEIFSGDDHIKISF